MSTQRERVDARSDARGFVHLCGHLAALLLSGTVLLRLWTTVLMVPALLAYAFVLIFLFSAEHECVHRTAFRSRVVNDSVAAFAGIWLLLPSRWFRLFHAAHHRFTQDSANDPELDGWKPPTRLGIVLQMTGLLYWKAMATVVWSLIRGHADVSFLPTGHRRNVVREARLLAVVYSTIGVASLLFKSWLAVKLWVIPALVGQPMLRWYLIAEHTGCPVDHGTTAGTRTTLTNPVLRYFAWNMPFHSEHHARPQVPFHRLPAEFQVQNVNRQNAADSGLIDRGYLRTVSAIQRDRWRRAVKTAR